MKWLSHIVLATLLFTGLLVAIRFYQQSSTGFATTGPVSQSLSETQTAQLNLLVSVLTPSPTSTPSLTPTATPSRTPRPTLTPRPTFDPEGTQEAGLYMVPKITETAVRAITQEPPKPLPCVTVTPSIYSNIPCEIPDE